MVINKKRSCRLKLKTRKNVFRSPEDTEYKSYSAGSSSSLALEGRPGKRTLRSS